MAGERLLNIMNNVRNEDKGDTTDLLFGVVTSKDPLKIKVDNRYEVTKDFLILSALCKETVIPIPAHTHVLQAHSTQSAGDPSHTHNISQKETVGGVTVTEEPATFTSIKLWRGLDVGDKVRMLRVNKGQSFYVIEREEGIV
jgi:hypothetical protein